MINLQTITKHDLGKYFEPLLLGVSSEKEIRLGCEKAKAYNARCVNSTPMWLPVVVECLAGTDVKVGAGISFPLGTDLPIVKAKACEEYVKRGANSIDFLINYDALKAGRYDIIQEEFKMIKHAAAGNECKAIFEVANLTDDQIKKGCELVLEAGIEWVKTSTGQIAGPTMPQLKIIFDALKGSPVRVKVSGVKAPRPQNAFAYISAGVEIIGSQNPYEIIDSLDLMREMGVIPFQK